jgi:hypothetical protein
MFFKSDAAPFLEFNFRPLPLWNNRFEQPVHVQTKIMQAAQINVGRDRAFTHHLQKCFAGCFNDDLIADKIEWFFFAAAFPAFLIVALFVGGQRVKGLLPSARGNAVFRSVKIRLGNLHIQHRLAQRLIFGVYDLPGFIFTVLGIHAIKCSAANAATNQTVTCFHGNFHATAKIRKTISNR